MRHSTLFIASLLGVALSAQAQSFKQVEQVKNQEKFMPLHRGIVTLADINGDGKLDVVYGGQYRPDNDKDGSGDVTFKTENDEYVLGEDDSKIVESHTKWAVQGNPEDPNSWFSLSWACTANIFLNQGGGNYAHEVASSWHHWGEGSRTSTEARGLLPTTYGGYHFFDANNDGRLDAIIYGQDEWGWKFAEYSGQKVGDDVQYVAFQLQNADGIFELQSCPFPKGWNENTNSLGNRANSSIAFGDYDHDGYTDVLVQCYHKWMDNEEESGERLVALYHNNGDATFTQVNVFNPIPYTENPKPADIFEADIDSGDMVPNMKAKPMSHGALAFADLNGDGWLDIITTGWSNDDDAALSFYIYQNMQDGTFQEVDLTGKSFVPVYESEIQVADMNNDGWVDIVVFGTEGGDNMPKIGDVYLNDGDGEFNFTRSTVGQGNGLYGASAAYAKLVDINHDGLVDVFSHGWTDVDEKGFGARIHLQKTDGTFSLDTDFGDPNTSHLTLGDVNGDGALDVIGDYWYDFGIWESQFTDGIENPDAPTNVKAEQKERGKLTISWTGDELNAGFAYNLYVKNKETGWISQLIPADIETGALRTYNSLGVALRSEDPSAMTYTMSVPDGVYEVGVQTLKNDWTTSAFTKAEVSVTDGIKTAKTTDSTATRIYDTNGRYMGTNVNSLGRGLFIVEKDHQMTKIIK